MFDEVDDYKAGWGDYPICFGGDPKDTRPLKMNLYSFKMYERVLLENEIMQNYLFEKSLENSRRDIK